MRKLTCSLVILLLVVMATSALAEKKLTEAQWWMWLEGEASLNQAETLGVRASTLFIVPTNAYLYAGPWWAPAEWLWIAPQVGVTSTIGTNDDAGVAALWVALTPTKWLSIFGDVEGWAAKDRTDVYSYSSVDGLFSLFNVGVQTESFNEDLALGIHGGVTKKPWGVEGQIYYDPKNEIWFPRVVGRLKF